MSTRYIGGLVYNPPGGWSGLFNGSSQYLTLPSGSAFAFGTGDFTVECFAYINSFPSNPNSVYFVDARNSGQTGTWAFLTSADGTDSTRLDWYTGSGVISGIKLTSATWLHLVYTRSSSTYGMFVNGIRVATGTDSTNYSTSPTTSYIASRFNATSLLNGYMSNLRVVKGSSVYSPSSTTLTVPTGALLPITNTVLLTCRYPTFVDGSASPITLTNVGTATVSTTNPFPTSALPNPALGGAGNGIYTLSQYASLLSAGTWPAYDPYYKNVTLNLHGNAGAVLPFNTDASTNNFQLTPVGNTSPSNYTPFIENGYWSNYFDGSSAIVNRSNNTALAMGTGDFTIEFWMNAPSTGVQVIYDTRLTTSSGTGGFNIYIDTGVIYAYGGATTNVSLVSGSYTANQWNHIAIVRSGSSTGNVKLYINGTLASTYGSADTSNYSLGYLAIGAFYNPSLASFYTGYLSNLRVVKGSAVYTGNFTPSTTPLTAITNTSLLTCQSNRFIDNSTNAFALTTSGSPAVNPLQPFTAPTGTSTYGSGYFDGSGDYLTAPDSAAFAFGSGDLTIECWCYSLVTTGGADQIILGKYTGSFGSSAFAMGQNNTTLTVTFYTGGSSYFTMTSSVALQGRVWNHIAATRSGNSWYLFLNGVQVANTTQSVTVISNTTPFYIGGEPYYNQMFTGYISNLRIVKGTAVYTSAFTPPTAPLTAITNTSLLTVQTNAPSQNNTFLDSSTNNFVITRNGNTTQGTFTPYGNNWSAYFDGSGDYLTVGSSGGTAIGASDFTIEFWIFMTNSSVTQIDYRPSSTNGAYISFGWIPGPSGTGSIDFYVNANSRITASVGPTLNGWSHMAISRVSGSTRVFIDGVQVGSTWADSTTYLASNLNVWWNAFLGARPGTGYFSNYRLVLSGLYSANFTPPTAPLTAISGTQALICQSNRFIDNSANAYAITRNGDVSVQRFSPFSPTTAYSTSVIGGSGYFDGSGDSLKVTYGSQMNLTNQDFAIEFWLYIPSALSNRSIVCQDQSNYQLNAYVDTSNNLTFYSYQAAGTQNFAVAMGAVPVGAWSHFVIARTGSTVAGFRNGTRIATATFSGSIDAQTGGWYLGAVYSNLNQINGYLSDVRFVIGSNPYGVGTTSTVPTAPLTTVTNTQFLASFTNAGILDNAMMNDLETVGNAQISTSVKKYGTGSMYFDGSGDRLTAPASPNIALGTGDFTIEGWFYINSGSGGNNGALQISGSTGGLQAGTTNTIALASADPGGGNAWSVYYANTYAYGSASVTQTWTHIALVRSSGSLKMYINGTADSTFGTKTDTTNYTGQNICVGGYYSTAYLWNGYIDDLRITKGVARYTANFTPPTSQLQDQ